MTQPVMILSVNKNRLPQKSPCLPWPALAYAPSPSCFHPTSARQDNYAYPQCPCLFFRMYRLEYKRPATAYMPGVVRHAREVGSAAVYLPKASKATVNLQLYILLHLIKHCARACTITYIGACFRKEKAPKSYPQAAFSGCFGHPLKTACG